MGRVKPARQKRQAAKSVAGVPKVDMGLMQRAARAIPIMTPGRLPLLMDAVEARGRAESGAFEWRLIVASEMYDFMIGKSESDSPPPGAARILPTEQTSTDVLESLGHINYRYQLAEYAVGSVKDRFAYFSTEEMTALILAGAEGEIESYALSAPDLPSPNGILHLNGTPGGAMLLWWSTNAKGHLIASTIHADTLRAWLEAEPGLLETPRTQAKLWAICSVDLTPVGSNTPPVHHGPRKYPEGVDPNDPLLLESARTVSIFLSFCHMLQQEVVDQTLSPSTTASHEKVSRSHRPSSRITYLSVRRKHPLSGAHHASGRQYSSRWVVRGFWRRQWYPSLNRHLPIWISEQIRGPEHAPLIYRDKVTIVKPSPDMPPESSNPHSVPPG